MTAATMHRRALARVVLTLLLAAALVPTLSRGLAHARGLAEPWAQLCATPGSAAARQPTPADSQAWHHLLEHCPLCSLDRDLPAWMPPVLAALPLLALAHAGPQDWFFQPLRTPQARWRAQPRAPPALF
jgi:Protein of unknown function (DUF2946)